MKQRAFISIILCFFILQTFAQTTTVRGTVSVYGSIGKGFKGEPVWVQGVYISTISGDADITDSQGSFRISFSGKEDRNTTELKVTLPKDSKYKDYFVVEEDRLKEITIGRKDSVRISICTKEVFQKKIDELYLPNSSRLMKEMNKEIMRLDDDLRLKTISEKQYRDSIKMLKEKNDFTERQYRIVAEYYACYNPDFADSIRQEVIYYIKQGKLDSAKTVLPDIEKAKEIYKTGENYLKDIDILAKASKDYESVDAIYNTRYGNIFNDSYENAIYFFNERFSDKNTIHSALEYIKRALNNAQNSCDTIICYNLLGQIQEYQHNPKAHKNYANAINSYTQLKKTGADDSLTEKAAAISYTLLANYYIVHNKSIAAEKNYKKALDIYISLNKKEDYDRANQINMLINLASLYVVQRKDTLVAQCYKRITLLMDTLIIQGESRAKIEKQLGDFNLVSRKFKGAIENYDKALGYYLKEENNEQNNFEIAKLYFSIGIAYRYWANKRESMKDEVLSLPRWADNRLEMHQTSIDSLNLALNRIDSTNSQHKLLEGFIEASIGKSYMSISIKNKDEKTKKIAEFHLQRAKKIAKETDKKDLKKYIKQKENDMGVTMINIVPKIGLGATVSIYILALIGLF